MPPLGKFCHASRNAATYTILTLSPFAAAILDEGIIVKSGPSGVELLH